MLNLCIQPAWSHSGHTHSINTERTQPSIPIDQIEIGLGESLFFTIIASPVLLHLTKRHLDKKENG